MKDTYLLYILYIRILFQPPKITEAIHFHSDPYY